jgi:hypothetical protein
MSNLTKTAPVLLALALATACSGSSSAKEVTPTKDTGTKAATAINLTKADLPSGWTSEPADNSDNTPDSTDKKIVTCLGLPATDTTDVSDINSDDFSKGQPPLATQVNSEVEVVASLAQASRLQKAFTGNKVEGCLKSVFADEAKSEAGATPGLKFGTPTVTKKAAPSGVDAGFAFAIGIPVQASGQTINVNTSIIGFFVKHTEVTLQTTVIGTPAADYDENALIGKLVERTKKSAV